MGEIERKVISLALSYMLVELVYQNNQ